MFDVVSTGMSNEGHFNYSEAEQIGMPVIQTHRALREQMVLNVMK